MSRCLRAGLSGIVALFLGCDHYALPTSGPPIVADQGDPGHMAAPSEHPDLPLPVPDAASPADASADLAGLALADASTAADLSRLCVGYYAVCPDGFRDEGPGLGSCNDLGASRWCVAAP